MSHANPIAIGPGSASEARPFYVMVTVWGKRFCDYFVDYCIPTLLSPGNIPALDGKRPCKVLIATTPEDWAAMSGSPIFAVLRQHAEPVFIEIPPCPPERSGCEHMGLGHKLQTDMAFRDKAYGMILTPDLMLSDGTMEMLDRHAAQGTEVVIAAAVRFGEEELFEHFHKTGKIRTDSATPGQQGKALTMSARELVAAAVTSQHSEGLSYEWDAPYYNNFPVLSWWNVPGETGIVVHSFSWAPLLLDYAVLAKHDTTVLENWTMDADYIHTNFSRSSKIHVIQDSDESFVLSWGPANERAVDIRPSLVLRLGALGQAFRGANLRWTFKLPGMFDPLKQQIFFLPVRWHSKPLNEAWTKVEAHAIKTIMSYIEPPDGSQPNGFDPHQAPEPIRTMVTAHVAPYRRRSAFHPLALKGLDGLSLFLRYLRRISDLLEQCWQNRATITKRIGQLLRGDPQAIRRVWWRLQTMAAQLRGRLLHTPGPPIPR